ncbi:MAG: aminomethyl-transferring glycine dehydrogenase subunit GcvPA [Nitrospinae bacterium]|nr:aminomethyl-transferring glycine dehydrogenase subunit GcvPA [Nitrospinota bacterium]MBF0635388.1 aminomethyl-transferring glycine dehydrogenase subunit GcvPA [Nitrospinota bacterium]
MRFIPLTSQDREKALKVIGASSVDELFSDIPEEARLKTPLNLPKPLSEQELIEHFEQLAEMNKPSSASSCFIGAGAYRHFVPSAVDQLLLRSEIFTAYTPYQPEISQGTLMAIFEFQTYTAALLGMDIANASMYDGASALAEAVIMAKRVTGKSRVVVSNLVHPNWRQVVNTYTQHLDVDIATLDCAVAGVTTAEAVSKALTKETSAVVVQYPNFLGHIEDLASIRTACDEAGALLIVAVAEPFALGILNGPGKFGADIVVGEGRSFGGALNFGGPGLGLFATKEKYARQMPGRLIGKTKDVDGTEGFTLTLATREQHIRREKATSNICSNQALCATSAAIHLSLLGKNGLRQTAIRNHSAAKYMADRISAIKGFKLAFGAPFFNEVAIHTPVTPAVVNKRLAQAGIAGGLDLGAFYPSLESAALFCATEVHNKKSIDRLAETLSEFGR